MAKRILKSKGRTAEEAIEHGLRKIHLPRESVEVRLLRQGRKILGLIPWDAIVYLIYDSLSTEVSLEQERNSSIAEAIEPGEELSTAAEVDIESGGEETEQPEVPAEKEAEPAGPEVMAETDSPEQEQVENAADDNPEATIEEEITEPGQSSDEEADTDDNPEALHAETGEKS